MSRLGQRLRVAEVRMPWEVAAVVRMAGSQPQQSLPLLETRGCDLAPVLLRGGSTALGSCRPLLSFPALLPACWVCLGHWSRPWPHTSLHCFLAGQLPRHVLAPLESMSPSREEGDSQALPAVKFPGALWSVHRCWHPVGIASTHLQLWSCESPGLFFMGRVQIRGHRLTWACRDRKQEPHRRWRSDFCCRKEEISSDFLLCSC